MLVYVHTSCSVGSRPYRLIKFSRIDARAGPRACFCASSSSFSIPGEKKTIMFSHKVFSLLAHVACMLNCLLILYHVHAVVLARVECMYV